MKEMLDIVFGSTGDDDFEPRSTCNRVAQNPQEHWTIFVVTTFIECINDKDESVLRVAREAADEVKEERIFHRSRCQIWVAAKTVCHDPSKRGEDFSEFGDESRKNVSEFAHIRVISLAEKRSSKPLTCVKIFTN